MRSPLICQTLLPAHTQYPKERGALRAIAEDREEQNVQGSEEGELEVDSRLWGL